MQSFPYLVLLCRSGGAYASVCLGVYMATPCFPVSGDVGDLESQTIPIGLWPYPPRPWTWLLGLGMRVSAVNTQLSQPLRGSLKKDAAKLLGRISPWHGCPPHPRCPRPPLGCVLGKEEEAEEEAEEAVFIRGVNTNEDPPNAHQAQHRPVGGGGCLY